MEAKDTFPQIQNTEELIKEATLSGIREMVEWIKTKRETPLGTDAFGYYIWERELQTFLKEKGIT